MVIKIHNTLSKKIEEFKPQDNNVIRWYICGPTVYDSSHIGHARTYITFDMIRGILEEYFNYDILYVMNITNIDDKIIQKSKEYVESLKEKLNKETKTDTKLKNEDERLKEKSEKELELQIGFRKVIEKYEKEFFEDMDNLNVKRPSIVTRVTDYVQKIIEYIDKILDKGYAYVSNQSVYFDSQKFKKDFCITNFISDSRSNDSTSIIKEHLENLHINSDRQSNEYHSPNAFEMEKRHPADFALWKRVSGDEIKFNSKWGYGRPGWHIECSVMASDIFANKMDIHSGGIDLKFPHHENEILQSTAYYETRWVNYFIHTGHLHIDGLKMSKSLKNFITIREALKKYTARQLRLFFALNHYNVTIDYKDETMKNVIIIEKRIYNFLKNIKSIKSNFRIYTENDKIAYNFYQDCKKAVHEAFEDNFDIPRALQSILQLISQINNKMESISSDMLNIIYLFVKKILKILRIDSGEKIIKNNDELPQILCDYRNSIRVVLKEKKPIQEFYKISDEMREKLKENGYIIEDKGNESVIKKIE